jgi:hypothetical protein
MLVGCGVATPESSKIAGTATDTYELVEAARVFTGIVNLEMSVDSMEEVFEPVTVIEDEAGFQKFVGEIPSKRVSRTNPAPENKDPLLTGAPVDFEKEMMIVLRWNCMTPPVCKMIRRRAQKQEVWVEYARDDLPRPYGTGAYTALVTDRFAGETVIRQMEPVR